MTEPPASLIDEIVREVLARLGGTASSGPSAAADTKPDEMPSNLTPPARPKQPPRQANELTISSRVVSLTDVEERLAGVRRLVVQPGAVVTPSVRDELRRKHIALVYGQLESACDNDRCRVLILVLGSRFEPGPLQNALVGGGLPAGEISVERLNCLIAATDRAAQALDESPTVVLLVSAHPAVALCLANRHAGVRAVLGIDPGRLKSDVASVGANLLVLDPRTTGPYQLNQMAVQFCLQGPLECPEALQERLDTAVREAT